MGSTKHVVAILACVAAIFFALALARPKDDSKVAAGDSAVESLKDELQWQKPSKDIENTGKDGWKAFKSEKPGKRRRWWEEDWNEEAWWDPKGSNTKDQKVTTTTTIPSTSSLPTTTNNKAAVDAKRGTKALDTSNKDSSNVSVKGATASEPVTTQSVKAAEGKKLDPEKQEMNATEEKVPEPYALPLTGSAMSPLPQVESFPEQTMSESKAAEKKESKAKNDEFAFAETSRETFGGFSYQGNDLMSPFEDPHPYLGPKDEAYPTGSSWEYHQSSGLGRYLDQGKTSQEGKNVNEAETAVGKNETQKPEAEEKAKKVEAEEEEKARKINEEQEQEEAKKLTEEAEEEKAKKLQEAKEKERKMKEEEKAKKLKEEDKERQLREKEENLKEEAQKEKEAEEKAQKSKEEKEEMGKKDLENNEKQVRNEVDEKNAAYEEDRKKTAALLKELEDSIPDKKDDRVFSPVDLKKEKVVDQFYGFGLESKPSVATKKEAKGKKKAGEKKSGETNKKKADKTPAKAEVVEAITKKSMGDELKKAEPLPADKGKESYNQGIIYDVVKGAPVEETHSVKKDLSNSDYLKEFVSTRASPQTSPNPPPPGLAQDKKLEQKTTLAPTKSPPSGEKTYIMSLPHTSCSVDQECRKGRMCRNSVCVCLPDDGCTGHHKAVCGTDGVEYPSICELHRTACVSRKHIAVKHEGACVVQHAKIDQMVKIVKDEYKDHLVATTTTTSRPVTDKHAELTKKYDDDSDDDDDDDYYDSDEDEEDDKSDNKDDVYHWLQDNVKVDSSKIKDVSKDLKKTQKDSKETKVEKTAQSKSPWETVEEETGQELKDKKGDQKKLSKGDDLDVQSDGAYRECSEHQLKIFKQQLLDFHCKKFQEPNCKTEVKEDRQYLTNLIFSYLDINIDYQLAYDELVSRQASEHYDKLNSVCQLLDFLWYDDIYSADGKLSLDEFTEAFNHLDNSSSETKTTSSPVVHIIPTLATVGNGLEVKCGLTVKGSDVVWRRNGINIKDLAMNELLVLEDGSLFFSKMGVHHMGNYSCEDTTDPASLQVHALRVQMPPIVKVSPNSQIEPSQTDIKIRCHAEGVPKPTISWEMNNTPIAADPHHLALEGNNELLVVYLADYQKDTGAYKCVAKNQAGTSDDVSSLFVIGDKERSLGMGFTSNDPGKFTIFHNQGFTAYNPDNCLKTHNVHSDFGSFKFIPDSLDGPLRLCDEGLDCSWGSVVNVKDNFLYVSQPNMNRVVVIETDKSWIPVQVIPTDKHPVQLHYVEHLDQVWVLCWNGDSDDSIKTIVVIRDASKYVQHRSVHTQPVGNRFDQIQALFIAPSNDLRHSFDFGYVTHNGQQGLTKVDLVNMRYVKTVDMSAYDCVPHSLAFVPIGGHIVVECVSTLNHQTLQLVMDYITDAVVSTSMLSGRPYVSPDSRHVVTVDDLTGKVSVSGVNNEGALEEAYEVTVSASISDVAFFPSTGHGYLLILTSADDDDIITINLSTGKVDKLRGTKRMSTSTDWHPSPVKRAITSGGVFSDYLLAPSKSSLSIVDIKFHQVQCEFTDAPHSQAAIFVGQQ